MLEEEVRQRLIEDMKVRLSFPASLLLVERQLQAIPHLSHNLAHTKAPMRRFDLVALAVNLHPIHPLYPLLMVECKAVPLKDAAFDQVIGYNQVVGAYFIAVAGIDEVMIGWKEGESYRFQKGLPTYNELINCVKGA